MTSLLLWAAGAVVSAFIGLLLTVLFQDRVSRALARVFPGSWFDGGDRDVSGVWWSYYAVSLDQEASSTAPEAILTIRLRQLGRRVIGTGVESSRDYFAQATFRDPYLTGTWRNYIDERYSWGAFQLFLLNDNRLMLGKFVGKNSQNFITDGIWLWAKSEHGLHDAARYAASRGYLFDVAKLKALLPTELGRAP
jgi:hypothetical protein